MLIYIIGKPQNQEELKAIWGHENIIFVDTVEEYRAHRDAQVGGTNAVHAIIDDELPIPTGRINVGTIGHIGRDKTQLTTIISRMDFAAIEARIAGHLSGKQAGTILVDSLAILDQLDNPMDAYLERLKKVEEPEPMPIEYRTRRSKGDKHRNRRHRWS